MKKHIICLVGLIAILVSTQVALTTSDLSSYDLMADFNRDRIVDADDLARLCNAYGSSLVLPSEPNKTVVTVLSFDKDPPEVENATVAIIDTGVFTEWFGDAVDVKYTNSSGIATFELDCNNNYTTIAWSTSAYNYANFTTNSYGEASVLILLGEPSLPPIRELPKGWIVITLVNNETGILHFKGAMAVEQIVRFDEAEHSFISENVAWLITDGGVIVVPPDKPCNEPHSTWGLWLIYPTGEFVGFSVYSPNENRSANVIFLVTPP